MVPVGCCAPLGNQQNDEGSTSVAIVESVTPNLVQTIKILRVSTSQLVSVHQLEDDSYILKGFTINYNDDETSYQLEEYSSDDGDYYKLKVYDSDLYVYLDQNKMLKVGIPPVDSSDSFTINEAQYEGLSHFIDTKYSCYMGFHLNGDPYCADPNSEIDSLVNIV